MNVTGRDPQMAQLLRQNVDAIGGAGAYSNFQFASNLSDSFKVFIRYAGPGTFWTDLPAGAKGLGDAADLKILESASRSGASAPPPTGSRPTR